MFMRIRVAGSGVKGCCYRVFGCLLRLHGKRGLFFFFFSGPEIICIFLEVKCF